MMNLAEVLFVVFLSVVGGIIAGYTIADSPYRECDRIGEVLKVKTLYANTACYVVHPDGTLVPFKAVEIEVK